MTGKLKYILILILAHIIADASAQNSQVLYYMNLPQNHLLNPALRPSNSVYIGLPVLTGVNLNINNNFVNFSDVIMKGQPRDSIISFLHPDYNVDNFLAKIKDKNFIETEAMVQLFGLGFSVGNDTYVFFDVNDRVQSNVVLPGDLFKLALKGNESFAGSKIDLSSLRGDMKYYREFGVGFSRNFTDRLRIGVKGKLLFGIANASIDNKSLGITVNEDYSHTLDANLAVNLSGPVIVYTDSKNNIDSIAFDDKRFNTSSDWIGFFSGKKNVGLGLDIGATYDITERIVVSAAITDLGFIRWKKDVTNLRANNQFEFSGLNMVDVINGSKTIDDVGKDMLDSLKDAFVVSKTKSPYTTYLPFGISLGGSYNITKQFSVGLLSYSRIIGKQLREALTLSANVNLGNAFSTTLSYTAENHQYDNLGAGLAFRPGIVQFYLITDRIPVTWNKIKDGKSTIPLPASWNTFNLRFGMNLVFGNRVKEKKDKPMILIE
jgi:hypothetical protein